MSQLDAISQGSRRQHAESAIASPLKYGGGGSIQGEDDGNSQLYQGPPQLGNQIVIRDMTTHYKDSEHQ